MAVKGTKRNLLKCPQTNAISHCRSFDVYPFGELKSWGVDVVDGQSFQISSR